MSRNFLTIPLQNYIGTPQAVAIKLAGISGQSIPLQFNWISYGGLSTTNLGVFVDLRAQPCVKLDQMRAIYIDNMGSVTPIYVQFDTGYTVVVQPNSSGWYPVYANAHYFSVFGLGFSAANVPTTTIIITNIPVPPYSDIELATAVELWLASPTITRGQSIFNTSLGTPALGDQATQPILSNVSPGFVFSNLWGSPYPAGFIRLTSVDIKLLEFAVSASPGQLTWNIESTGIAGVLFNIFASGVQGSLTTGSGSPSIASLLQLSNCNILLDATQTWQIRVTTNVNFVAAVYQNAFTYTVQ